ncbi:MAG: D-tyrosyl-tRNA(Tyr) deacylase [Gammaproteobacteria bacterium]|nr:MAG: D-tyrosyl-tRNA(Tyr) deacylase [Gammaproteobacteria bacterium]
MLALIQRVTHANVVVEGEMLGAIEQGIMALIGIEKGDNEANARRLWERISGYRMFADQQDKMNLSVKDIDGSVLLVPQFTLAADTKKGMRPSFSSAATPDISRQLFDYFCDHSLEQYPKVEQGCFGANMQVSLCNDGPVTFLLKV